VAVLIMALVGQLTFGLAQVHLHWMMIRLLF